MTPCPAHRTQRQKDFSQVLAHILQWTSLSTYLAYAVGAEQLDKLSLGGFSHDYILRIFHENFADFCIHNILCGGDMYHGRSVLTYCLRGATSVFEVLGLTPLLTPRGIVTLSTPLDVVVVVYHVSIVECGGGNCLTSE